MWPQLFRRAPGKALSLQARIRETIAGAILDQLLQPGTEVPSTRRLAQDLRVSRNTVTIAYQMLVDEGFLVADRRSGHRVHPEVFKHRMPRGFASENRAAVPPLDWASRCKMRPSTQRNVIKPADWQRFPYPFVYGQFDPQLMPITAWREATQSALAVGEIRSWASDRIDSDDPMLVEQVQRRVLPTRGVWATTDEILVTVGAQHALYLIADLLVAPDTVVGMENPGYPDARNIFGAKTRRLRALPLDEHGIIVDERVAGCDCVYVTASHQSPTNCTMPLDRRRALLSLAETRDVVLIEDDYESELRFSGAPIPALKSLDAAGRVIYVGSLSKSLAPGLRVGYIVAPRPLIRELRALRRLMLRHPATNNQRAVAFFLSLGHYDTLLRRLVAAYRERAEVLGQALLDYFPGSVPGINTGGTSYWVKGPAQLDARQLAKEAAGRGVLLEPGEVFFMAEDHPQNFFRLGYASIAAERIEPGIRLLAESVRTCRQLTR